LSRRLRLTLVSLLGVGLVCAALATFIFSTEQGLQLLWRQIEGLLPAELSIGRVEGRISGPLEVQGLRYESETLRLELDLARLEWSPAKLLAGTLWLDRLALRGLNYISLKTAPDEAETTVLPESIRLPFRVVAEELSLDDASYLPAPDSEPLQLDHARLSAEISEQSWSISRIRFKAPRLDLQGNIQLQVNKNYRIEVQTQWQLRPPGYPPLDGRTEVRGDLDELLVTQTLSSPYHSQAELTLTDPLDELRFAAKWTLEEIALQAVDSKLPALRIHGEFTGSGDLAESRITAVLNIQDAEFGELQALFSGGLSSQALAIDNLRLALTDQPGFIETQGRILFGPQQPVMELRAVWEDLRWPLRGQPMVVSPAGRTEVNGSTESYRFTLGAQLKVPEQTDGRIELEGTGDLASAQLSSLVVTTLGGKLSGNADLSWQPQLKARINISGKGLDPGILFAGWTGDLALQTATEAELKEGLFLARIDQLDVKGDLRGYPLHLNARGGVDEKGLRLSTASLTSGSTTLAASGLVGESLDLKWQVRSSDLASLLPDAAGRLQGGGIARGTLEMPQLEAELKGEDLKYGSHVLKHLQLETNLDLSGKRDSHLLLELTNGKLAEIAVDRLKLIGNGNPGSHRVQLEAVTNRGSGEIQLTAGLQGDRWQFQLGRGQLKYPNLAAWALQSPSNGWISKDAANLSLSRSCWASGEAVLCLNGSRSPEQWEGEFDLKDLAFAYFAPWLPAEVQAQGKVGGRGRLLQPASADEMQASIRLETSAGQLLSSITDDEEVPVLAFKAGGARFDLKPQAMSLEVKLPFEPAGGMDMEAQVPAGARPLLERPLSGNLVLRVPDMAIIGDLLPDVDRTQGRLEGKATLSGTLAAPRFRGRLLLADGTAELPGPGIALSDIRAELSGREDGDIDVSAALSSGPGSLRIEGTANIAEGGLASDLVISGDDFQLLDLPEAEVRVSPAMKLQLSEKKVSIEGDVKVPYAKIRLKSLPASAVAVSPDQVIIQPGAETPQTPVGARRINARLRVILGDNVRFDGLGLKAKFAGNLLLIEQPGQLTTASGEVRLSEGTYRAYGQNLVIERGRLLYAGGLVSEPGLDVRAIRRPAEGIEVGVEARGTLKNPEFTLFSEPAMSQSEQLSYLVLGRPLEGGTSSEEGSAMNRAAMALGLAGGGAVAEQFGEQFGIDNVGIQSGPNESTEEASLVVGKYLSPKLYVGYGVGLFDPVSTIWLRYTLSSNWKLVTETSSEASGADLYYTIDRGQ